MSSQSASGRWGWSWSSHCLAQSWPLTLTLTSPSPCSSATPHTNPFLEQTSGTYTSQVPLSGSHPTTVDDITSGGTTGSSSSLTGGASSSSSGVRNADGTTSSAGQEIRAQAQNSDTAASVQQKAQEATQDFKQSLASLTDGQTKPGLAGDLAPSQSPIDPKAAPVGPSLLLALTYTQSLIQSVPRTHHRRAPSTSPTSSLASPAPSSPPPPPHSRSPRPQPHQSSATASQRSAPASPL